MRFGGRGSLQPSRHFYHLLLYSFQGGTVAWGGQGVHKAVSTQSPKNLSPIPTSASTHSEFVASDTKEDTQPPALPANIERKTDFFSHVAGAEESGQLGCSGNREGGGDGRAALTTRKAEIAVGSKLAISSEFRPAMQGTDNSSASPSASEVFLALKTALLIPAEIRIAAEELMELMHEKLRPLWGNVDGFLLCQLVIKGKFPSEFVPAVTQWAVGQPDWEHVCVMYSRLAGYVGRQRDRQGLMEIIKMALDISCAL